MSIENKADQVLKQAKALAPRVETWADFSVQLFDPHIGLVAKAFPEEIQRQAFYDSTQYEEINAILLDLMKKYGEANGATPQQKSGKFVVRVPKTIHQSLEIEAKREGVSLNLLAVTKLSLPLRDTKSISRELIIQSFNEVHNGHSPDWVIVEPKSNSRFLERCRQHGLSQGDLILNQVLMNIRKTAKYKGMLNKTTERSGFQDYDDYAFAAEIAVRTLQRTEGVTLDRILCDPALREEFDRIAMQLAPDQPPVKLRYAALNLRKTHRLQPLDKDKAALKYDLISAGPVRSIDLSAISTLPGTYAFFDQKRPIFAGETENLHKRIGLHLGPGLPDWLGARDDEDFILKFLVLPSVRKEDRLEWLGSFINNERPLLNYQNVA
jgi:predicted HicB family RNase H-like nuclease